MTIIASTTLKPKTKLAIGRSAGGREIRRGNKNGDHVGLETAAIKSRSETLRTPNISARCSIVAVEQYK